jgi:acyl dehydratase
VRYWDELEVGLRDGFVVRLSSDALDTFAILIGDGNPLHMSDQAAAAAGFRGRVMHGMLTSSLYSRLVGMHLPGEYSLLQAIEISFRNPAYADEDLSVSGEIVSRSEAARVVQIKATITREGLVLSNASIRVGIRKEGFGPARTG